jgi:hypothetical protein
MQGIRISLEFAHGWWCDHSKDHRTPRMIRQANH